MPQAFRLSQVVFELPPLVSRDIRIDQIISLKQQPDPNGRQAFVMQLLHQGRDAQRKRPVSLQNADLNPVDRTLAAEVQRLTALGATVLARYGRGFDLGWFVLADPEGNEFCVQSSDAEVAAVEARLDAEETESSNRR